MHAVQQREFGDQGQQVDQRCHEHTKRDGQQDRDVVYCQLEEHAEAGEESGLVCLARQLLRTCDVASLLGGSLRHGGFMKPRGFIRILGAGLQPGSPRALGGHEFSARVLGSSVSGIQLALTRDDLLVRPLQGGFDAAVLIFGQLGVAEFGTPLGSSAAGILKRLVGLGHLGLCGVHGRLCVGDRLRRGAGALKRAVRLVGFGLQLPGLGLKRVEAAGLGAQALGAGHVCQCRLVQFEVDPALERHDRERQHLQADQRQAEGQPDRHQALLAWLERGQHDDFHRQAQGGKEAEEDHLQQRAGLVGYKRAHFQRHRDAGPESGQQHQHAHCGVRRLLRLGSSRQDAPIRADQAVADAYKAGPAMEECAEALDEVEKYVHNSLLGVRMRRTVRLAVPFQGTGVIAARRCIGRNQTRRGDFSRSGRVGSYFTALSNAMLQPTRTAGAPNKKCGLPRIVRALGKKITLQTRSSAKVCTEPSMSAQLDIERQLSAPTRHRVVRLCLSPSARSAIANRGRQESIGGGVGGQLDPLAQALFRVLTEVATAVLQALGPETAGAEVTAACVSAWSHGWFRVNQDLTDRSVLARVWCAIERELGHRCQHLEKLLGVGVLETAQTAEFLRGLVALCFAAPSLPEGDLSDAVDVEVAARAFLTRCDHPVLKRAFRFCGGAEAKSDPSIGSAVAATRTKQRRAHLADLRETVRSQTTQVVATWQLIAETHSESGSEADRSKRDLHAPLGSWRAHRQWWTALLDQGIEAAPPPKSHWVREVNWLLAAIKCCMKDQRSTSSVDILPSENWLTSLRLSLGEMEAGGSSIQAFSAVSNDAGSSFESEADYQSSWVRTMAVVAVAARKLLDVDDERVANAWAATHVSRASRKEGPRQPTAPASVLPSSGVDTALSKSWVALSEALATQELASEIERLLPAHAKRAVAQEVLFLQQMCGLVMTALDWPEVPRLSDVLDDVLQRFTNDKTRRRSQAVLSVDGIVSKTVAPMRTTQATLSRVLDALDEANRAFAAYAVASKAYAVLCAAGPATRSLGLRAEEPCVKAADDSNRVRLKTYAEEVLERHRKILKDLIDADSGSYAPRGLARAEALKTLLESNHYAELYSVLQGKSPVLKAQSPSECPDLGYLLGISYRDTIYDKTQDLTLFNKAIVRPLLTVPFRPQWDGSDGWFLPKVQKDQIAWLLRWHGQRSNEFSPIYARLKSLAWQA